MKSPSQASRLALIFLSLELATGCRADPVRCSEESCSGYDDADVDTCQYPSEPHAFEQGAVVPAMVWESAIAGVDQSGSADLEEMFCDPDVKSIFFQLASPACESCPERMSQIAGLQTHWANQGVRWIFVIEDVSSPEEADEYVERAGVPFGFRTDDHDNSLGSYAIINSGLYEAVPWTGVVRSADMLLLYDEADDSYLDIETIAAELAADD